MNIETLNTMNNTYYRKIIKPVNKLVEEGVTQLGNFSGAFTHVNPLNVDTIWGMKPPRFFKNFRLKEWQAFQFWYKDYVALGAVYNAKWVGVIVFSVFNFKTRENYHTFILTPSFKTKIAQGLFKSQSAAKMNGIELLIKNNLEVNRIQVEGTSVPDGVKLLLTGFHITEPSVVCIPFAKSRFIYSHKSLMPCEGNLILHGKTHVVSRNEALMMLDDHKGFYPRKYSYERATASWFDREGNYYGFNVTHNQCIDAENYNENCFWVNGKMHALPPVEFNIDTENKSWHIKDTYDMVNLNFKIISQNENSINLGIINSDSQASYGTFTGIIKNMHHTLRLNNTNGMGEIKRDKM